MLWLIFALGSTSVIHASGPVLNTQPYSVTNWQTGDGLPENSATSIVQSPDGYLWVGTFNGLARFDGRRFVVFNQRNMPGLPNLGVVNLHISPLSGFWVSTLGGLANHRNGRWFTLRPEDGWNGNYVRFTAENSRGMICFTTFDHKVFITDGLRLKQLPSPPGRTDLNFPFFGQDGTLHIAGRDYLNSWIGDSWRSAVLPPSLRATGVDLGWGVSPRGKLLAVAGSSLYRMDGAHIEERIQLSQTIRSIWSVTVEDDGTTWVCSYTEGLYRIARTGTVHRYSASDGLRAQNARFVYRDRQGNWWVGTSGTGLFRLRERRVHSIGEREGLPPVPVKAVVPEPDGGVLLATYGRGIWRFRAGKLTQLPSGFAAPDFAQTLMRDSRGRLWVGRYNQPLSLLAEGVERRLSPAQTGGANSISLFEDSRGTVWIAGPQEIASFDGKSFTRHRLIARRDGVPVRCFAEDRPFARMWAAGDAGLLLFNGNDYVQQLDGQGNPLPPLTFVYAAGSGSLWLGLAEGGLMRWRNGRATTLAEGSVPFGTIGGILEDGGVVWFATNRGIIRIPRDQLDSAFGDPKAELSWQRFTKQYGLPSDECTVDHQPSASKDAKGRLWFSTLNGAAMIDPKALAIDTSNVGVKFEEVEHLDPDGRPRHYSVRGDSLPNSIPPQAMNLRISYTATDLSDGDGVLFNYQLAHDGNLVASGNLPARHLLFPALNHGAYTLTIRARNSHGVWSNNTARLRFQVDPSFLERRSVRGAFLLLIGAALTGSTLVAARRRMRHRINRLSEAKRLAEAEASRIQAMKMESLGRMAGGVAHDFNNLLTVVNGFSEILLHELPQGHGARGKVEEIWKAGAKGAELTSQLLTYSRRQKTESTQVDLSALITGMLTLLESMATSRVKVKTALDPRLRLISANTAQLTQLVMNLVVNARDAMPAGGTVTIETRNVLFHRIERPGSYVALSITDTGVGMDEATRSRIFEPFFTTKEESGGTGMGLSTVHSIVQGANGWIDVESVLGSGTEFHVYFPALHDGPEGSPSRS